jgi:glycosyltransferase involved in cell wall biosynthesis
MLGMGWFPDTLGGLDRYYRALFEQLPEASGVVIGPGADAPAAIALAAPRESSLPRRLLAYRRAAERAGAEAEVIDGHFALYAAAPLLLGALRKRPSVFHFHGPWAQEALAAGDASGLGARLRRALERRVLRHADAHVVLSSAFRRVLTERYGIRPWDVHVWPPGVALEHFTPGDRAAARERLGIAENAFLALCTRRLVARMGIGVLLDAWEQIAAGLPDGSTLALVGEGALQQELTARAGQGVLAGSVRVLGRVPDEQLIELYRAADVAVVPTISFEGFGLVVLEAAACGTASIVSDVGGLPEVAAPLDPSLVVVAGDAAALAARIEQAAHGAVPSREATRRYAERFSWPQVAERHRELHRRLAGGERDERTRVVYLDHVARMSGGEIALLRLLPHLREINAHVILGEDGPFALALQRAGVSVEVLPIAAGARDMRREHVRLSGLSPAPALQSLAYVARLARRLRELDADLVHTNSLKAGVYGSLAAQAAGVPLVWHVRDRIADDYIPRPAVRFVRSLVSALPDGVVANSTATLATLARPRRGHVHRVIADSVLPSPHTPSPTPGTLTFGMAGRIARWKGQDLFLRAFAAAFPERAARAVLVGSAMFGEEDYERELHELVAELGLGERVEFRGFREDIWQELASFDVLVHASVIPEPFGQVVLEGMAAGLPVIAPDEGGPAAVIADGQTGRLFRSRDADSLARAMRALAGDASARLALGGAARAAVAEYHPDRVAEQLQALYGQVLGGRPRRAKRAR